jgi:hypothetical protein
LFGSESRIRKYDTKYKYTKFSHDVSPMLVTYG